jgi:hypothetical protein
VESNPLAGFMITWLATDMSPSTSDSGALAASFLRRTSSASDVFLGAAQESGRRKSQGPSGAAERASDRSPACRQVIAR